MPVDGRRRIDAACSRLIDRVPDLAEHSVEGDSDVVAHIQWGCILYERFQSGGDVGVARRLAAGQGAGVPAQTRQILRNGLGNQHWVPLSLFVAAVDPTWNPI